MVLTNLESRSNLLDDQMIQGPVLLGDSRVEFVRHVSINKAGKSSFGAPRQVILQSDSTRSYI